MKVRIAISIVTIVATLIAPALFAAEPIQVRAVPCVSAAQNPRIVASLPPNTKSARVYFRGEGQTAEYYVDMRRGENGNWWAFLPMPEAKTTAIAYRAVPVDSKGVQTSSLVLTTTVSPSCPLQSLTADEQRITQNLVVGLTTPSQSSVPTGFQCRGAVSYITANGDLKPNDECRRILAAAAGAGTGAAAAAGGATIAGMSATTFAALAALGVAAGGYAVYENNKSTTPASPSNP